nr:substrate-binding domain-containing protein [uncultured Flavobacterium sp.]
MKKYTKLLLFAFTSISLVACKQDPNKNQPGNPASFDETPVQGTAIVLVDETIFPVIEDAEAVFENIYDKADLNLIPKAQNEIYVDLLKDEGRIAILARDLEPKEIEYFNQIPVYPVRTHIATDAIAFITAKTAKDSIIQYAEIEKILKGEKSDKKLYFDNSNSSTVHTLLKHFNIDKIPAENVFAAKSNSEVIQNSTKDINAIGIVGVNWLTQPGKLQPQVDQIKVLGIVKDSKIVKPNQTELMDKSYPFTRDIYLINIQGKTGLGMGFASYLAGDDGQRIILKAGLLPTRMPTREINIVK